MQSPGEMTDTPDQTQDSTTTTPGRSQSYVYPIRSLLGTVQPFKDGTVFDAIMSPPPGSAQTPVNEPEDPARYAKLDELHQKTLEMAADNYEPTGEGYTFRHYPEREASRSFITNKHVAFVKDRVNEARSIQPTQSASIPHAIIEEEREDGTIEVRETEVVAPKPIMPLGRITESLQQSAADAKIEDWREAVSASADEKDTPDAEETTTRTRKLSQPTSPKRNFIDLVYLPPVRSAEEQTQQHTGRLGSKDPSSANSRQQAKTSEKEAATSQEAKNAASFTVTTQSSDGAGPMVTMRFEHTEDENGHHVLVGREGTLKKCEDEPIRIPGAIQGFGVLIVLHDDFTSGQLKVRQVSENSKIILGLSPSYLFRLECFTDTLPSSQADLLWDNVQFLSDPESGEDEEEGDESPQVFLLSGWGEPGTAMAGNSDPQNRRQWSCWVAAHRTRNLAVDSESLSPRRKLIILEFELENDLFNPLYPLPATPSTSSDGSSPIPRSGSGETASSNSGTEQVKGASGSDTATPSDITPQPTEDKPNTVTTRPHPGELIVEQTEEWVPSAEAIINSTTSRSRPLRSLERMRRFSRSSAVPGRLLSGQRAANHGIGTMDVFTVLQEVNEQLGKALDLLELLEIIVGIVKDLTQFHRVLCYQFDDAWNGQVVAELVDWSQTNDLYHGLHFPAADIPAQARHLYALNRVRLIYDRSQSTARLVVKDKTDLEPPLDMTHCYLRAVSPIHLKYLGNMQVRASMSISIVAFQKLWGLIACHSYGGQGMRVSFPVRQMLRLLSDSISRNVERLSYAQRLRTRKLISTVPTDQHPTGYIVSNSEDLLTLFDADCGVLVIGEGAKILGPNEHGQDILLLAEYLRVKQFTLLQVSQSVMQDYPDLRLPSGLDVIAGLLYVPLSITGRDFIALLRKGQTNEVNWAGRPPNKSEGGLEPRSSFKLWTERLTGRCRQWTDEQLDTAAVLALVYGKFIEVWRQKESAVQMNQMTTLLLSNASHEVRTPLHQIINYLELALDDTSGSKLDEETRENLIRSHAASKALLFTINDLLDLTRLEAGKETSFNEPFNLHIALHDAVKVYRVEAMRRRLEFQIDLGNAPQMVIGDVRKVKTVVANLTSNAVKYTQNGSVMVTAHTFEEPDGLREHGNVAVEIVISDTGCGIQPEKLESIFREFEQVDTSGGRRSPHTDTRTGMGLGLAVVARVVEQLGGQLRVDSNIDQGSRFSCLLPFPTIEPGQLTVSSGSTDEGVGSGASNLSEIDSLVEALSTSHMMPHRPPMSPGAALPRRPKARKVRPPKDGKFDVEDSYFPVRAIKVDEFDVDSPPAVGGSVVPLRPQGSLKQIHPRSSERGRQGDVLRILVVEDDLINSRVLKKRLISDGHQVVTVVNGQQAVDLIEQDRDFDCVLMDIQMPILDGFGATKGIRNIEKTKPLEKLPRRSVALVGHIPIFAVSASLTEDQRPYMIELGMDGWILKPIEFKRMAVLLSGINNIAIRNQHAYHQGCVWEYGGWLEKPPLSLNPPSEYSDSPASEPKSAPSSQGPSPKSTK